MTRERNDKGISTVFGTMLFLLVAGGVASTLFLGVYNHNLAVNEAMKTDEQRLQEKIVLSRMGIENDTGTPYISWLEIKNAGALTSLIKAIYIDNQFQFDPSFQGSTISPLQAQNITFPIQVIYEPISKVTATTERGVKSVEYEYVLLGILPPESVNMTGPPYGPLRLHFDEFYYSICDPQTGDYTPPDWKPGWRIETGTGTIVWKIRVTNIDHRNITLTSYSCFTLVPNDDPASRRPWYMEPSEDLSPANLSIFIPSGGTTDIVYIWSTPKTKQMNTRQIYTASCRCKVFLTFFGTFHEELGTKPYAQTIPFESVLVENAGTLQISAWPTRIPSNSTIMSTITAIAAYKGGQPAVGQPVMFTTTDGNVTPSTTTTDANGVATAILNASVTPATAMVTATWDVLIQKTYIDVVPDLLYVITDGPSYGQNDTVSFTGLLRNGSGDPITNVTVTLELSNALNETIWTALTTTSSQGLFTETTTLSNAAPGIYTIRARYEDLALVSISVFGVIGA